MSNRFVDNETPLDAATLNQFEDDMKEAAKEPASQTDFGSVKIWVNGSTLYISTQK